MTIVTSSRKPTPEVRKLAKEIAFALDFPYIQRGKTGLREFGDEDPKMIFLSGSKRKGQLFDRTVNGEIVFSMLITNTIVSERTGVFYKGFVTREEELFARLSRYVPTVFDEEADGPICFCGTQKMQYVLQVMV
ncbi:MAG: hypothetical protein Q4Q04_04165 [Methanocorpusculum sp.]|nr:hypothetical protein [Methanocorpusculum sp.]